MFFANIVLLVCVSYVIFTPVLSDVPMKDVDAEIERDELILQDIEEYLSVGKDDEMKEILEIERRRIIASKYLETLESVKHEWIDPYDMGGVSLKENSEQIISTTTALETTSVPPTITKNDDSPSLNNVKKEELCTSTSGITLETLSAPKEQQCVLDNVYITRWLKKVLHRIEKEPGTEYSDISFHLDSDTIDNLKQMASSKTFEVAKLDDMLSNLLAQAVIKQKENYFAAAFTYQTDILKIIAYASGVAVSIYTLRRSFMHRPKLTLLVCGIVINICWHWMHLYQKIKAHKHAELSSMQIPAQCKKHDLGLLEHMSEYLKSFFSTSECSKYYEALLVDPFWEVSLSVAATEAATATIFQPLFASSRAVNYFLKQLFEGLPIYVTAFLIVFIFFVTLMKFGYAIRLPLFMGRIEPCHPVPGSRVEELERPTQLPNLTDTVRNAITDTKDTNVKQVLQEDSSMKTTFTGTSKECHSQSIQYTSNEDGSGTCVFRQNSQTSTFRSTVDFEGFPPGIDDKTISEEGLAVRSGYFEVLGDGESSKLTKRTISETENVDMKICPNETTVSATSSKYPTTLACLDTVAKRDLDVHASSTQVKDALVPDTIESHPDDHDMPLDINDVNLPDNLNDSFEIIPNSDVMSSSMSRSAGPNCDTSQDILSVMHRGCRFCN